MSKIDPESVPKKIYLLLDEHVETFDEYDEYTINITPEASGIWAEYALVSFGRPKVVVSMEEED